jgi:hypothetical protein
MRTKLAEVQNKKQAQSRALKNNERTNKNFKQRIIKQPTTYPFFIRNFLKETYGIIKFLQGRM